MINGGGGHGGNGGGGGGSGSGGGDVEEAAPIRGRGGTGRVVRPSLYGPRPESNCRPLSPSRHWRSPKHPIHHLDPQSQTR